MRLAAFVSIEEMENKALLEQIAVAKPDVLLVALGSPKQEKWIYRHRSRLNVPVCVLGSVGPSISSPARPFGHPVGFSGQDSSGFTDSCTIPAGFGGAI